ncbi:hypothetical protein F511_44389 [Dorcoceras hygrometricum]|uniref:Uncharacterized protein n=1 Tax=Dorcoceras hygrometricum TaxID=472368 RepID=A0A2Z7AXU9_9LAMI|nr:hypothetical protein F511_44389 [Dorcoceras hygrometricum]
MKICWLWCELKLLLADIARSVSLSEEVTRVSQHFGVLTIEFSSCACVTYPLLLVAIALFWLLLISRRAYVRALRSGVVCLSKNAAFWSFAFRDQQLAALLTYMKWRRLD